MNWEVDILDTSLICFEGDFDTQVQNILFFVRLTADRVNSFSLLFEDLEQAMQRLVPGCRIEPFGSVVTGLGIKTSDVDCFVALPEGIQPSVKHVVLARNILRRYHRKFAQIFAITQARIPIVKFLHVPTNCCCDINFKSRAGVQNSKLIGFLLHWDSRALPLAVLIRYWSKIHNFTGTNLLANYSLMMMVIFYLQLMNILPPVSALQRNVPSYLIDNWNSAFDDTMFSDTTNSASLYDLMGGFFKCYSTFNYKENIISPFLGRVLNKKCFENLNDVPEEFYLYKDHVSQNLCPKIRLESKICIQDPFEHNKNCSVAVFDKLADRIVAHFQFASKKFEEVTADNFLKAIYTQDPINVPHRATNNMKLPIKRFFQHKVTKHKNRKVKRGLTTGFNIWFTEMNRTKEKR